MKIEVSGKSIQEAIDLGLQQLNTTLDNVDVEVINDGGMFKKAKIEMTLATQTSQVVVKNTEQPKLKEEKPAVEKPKTQSKPKSQKVEVVEKTTVVEQEIDKSQNIEEVEEVSTQNAEDAERNKKVCDLAVEWLNGLIYSYNINATVEAKVSSSNKINLNIVGENLSVLIGYQGQCIDAIQNVLNCYLYNNIKGAKRVYLDVCGYHAEKKDKLINTALTMAEKVQEQKSSYKLQPMNSFERRLVHAKLCKLPNIATHSQGEEPNRCIVIAYKEN